MLNVNEIAARIENPSITQANDAEDLKLLAEKYPYTQMFSILYLQSLKQAGDIHFEDELKKHSFRITDRAQLFNLIESTHSVSAEPTPVLESQESVESAVDEIEETLEEESQTSAPLSPLDKKKDEVVSEEVVEKVVSPVHEEEQIVSDEPEVIVDEPQIDSDNLQKEEAEIEEILIDSDEPEFTVEETTIESESDPIEETVLETETPDVSSENEPEKEELDSYRIEEAFKDAPSVDEDKKDSLDQTIEHHIYAANYQLDSLSAEEEQRLKEKEAQNQKETSTEEEKTEIKEDLSFTSWLQANDNYIEPEEEVVTVTVVPEFSDFDPSNPLFGEQERPKKEFFSAPRKAKKSLTEETVPVSETLAKVYAMQGNYPKAIAAYEQLMLTIPEKKSFFASLIEDLKTKLNT